MGLLKDKSLPDNDLTASAMTKTVVRRIRRLLLNHWNRDCSPASQSGWRLLPFSLGGAKKVEPASGLRGLGPGSGGVAFGLGLLAGEAFGHGGEGLRDAGPRGLVDERHAVIANLDHRLVIVRKLPEDVAAHRLLGLLEADGAALQADAVDDDADLVLEPFDFTERKQQAHHVP